MSSEKALLIIIDEKRRDAWPVSDLKAEMTELVKAGHGTVVECLVCSLKEPNPATLIGEGKTLEIAALCAGLKVDTVIFSMDLKGSQQRNLEEIFKVRVVDRTQLILDIFARRAKSQEGQMQVELAQLEYLLPRLTGKGIEMSRLGGGIGTLGPGETKLEVDRRRIGARIARLKKDLKNVALDRQTKRKKRREKQIPAVSLVGYTNAGKSTLLNALTEAGQRTKDGLFTTLDPLARQYTLPNQQTIVLSDTVGFMHELPHHLVESFHATLEEVREADLLLHVVDVSHHNFRALQESVVQVLNGLGATDKPTVLVFNKIDQLADRAVLEDLAREFENAVFISALTGENLPELVRTIEASVRSGVVEIEVDLPLARMDLVRLAHNQGKVHTVRYSAETIHLHATVPLAIAERFRARKGE